MLALSRSKARRENLEAEMMARFKADAEQKDETADRKEDGGE